MKMIISKIVCVPTRMKIKRKSTDIENERLNAGSAWDFDFKCGKYV